MNKLLLFLSILPAACASSDDQAASQMSEQAAPNATEEVYIFRIERSQEPKAQARFTGQYEIVNGCLAFRSGPQLYLPAMSGSAQATISGNEVIFGDRVIELGVDTLIVGGVFQGDLKAILSAHPPSECRWPVIE